MGCDIHPVVQRRKSAAFPWEFVIYTPPDYNKHVKDKQSHPFDTDILVKNPIWRGLKERNYVEFAVLADVRNNWGIVPIAQPRGLPDGLSEHCEESQIPAIYGPYGEKWKEEGEQYVSLGDHSFSYLYLNEIINYPHWDDVIGEDNTYLNEKAFLKWGFKGSAMDYANKTKQPLYIKGGPWDNDIQRICPVTYATGLYDKSKDFVIEIVEPQRIRDCCADLLNHTVPWLHTLGTPDNVRIVFGFDS